MKKNIKSVSLLLVFSLAILSGDMLAIERRGAVLLIQKKDSREIKGELIVIKPNALLLLDSVTGADESVDFKDVAAITIVKKSKALVGATFGAFAGGAIGAAVIPMIGKPAPIIFSSMFADESTIVKGLLFGSIIGTVLGGAIGASEGININIQIKGMSDLEIKEAIDKLRKKARIRNYK
ncbi:MAG: hypothetical protein GTO16_10295 [Candidatus Aminicenantes bacterium]|nr:hypothetical protein [Candidatus Aminicenantes bacterium]